MEPLFEAETVYTYELYKELNKAVYKKIYHYTIKVAFGAVCVFFLLNYVGGDKHLQFDFQPFGDCNLFIIVIFHNKSINKKDMEVKQAYAKHSCSILVL